MLFFQGDSDTFSFEEITDFPALKQMSEVKLHTASESGIYVCTKLYQCCIGEIIEVTY